MYEDVGCDVWVLINKPVFVFEYREIYLYVKSSFIKKYCIRLTYRLNVRFSSDEWFLVSFVVFFSCYLIAKCMKMILCFELL